MRIFTTYIELVVNSPIPLDNITMHEILEKVNDDPEWSAVLMNKNVKL